MKWIELDELDELDELVQWWVEWNVCQVAVTESIVVFLQSRSSIYISTDLLLFFFFFFFYSHSLALVFIERFPNFFREVCSLKWPVTIKNLALAL